MERSKVHFLWQDGAVVRRFRTGVCLHGHTMHSQECLSFLPRYLHAVPGISQIARHYERPHAGGRGVDFAQAYWTPPLAPAAALQLERGQVERLGLKALVSLTDHDDIEAGLALQVAADREEAPISVEWTVPYDGSIFHLGIHNLPAHEERLWMAAMAQYTGEPVEDGLPELLASLSGMPDVLIVLNHPFWLEEGMEEAGHRAALERFRRECLAWIHALELNGTRGWAENAEALALAQFHGLPVISGGDRHGCEPSSCLNLTNASTFAEFIAEIRAAQSTLLFMPQYKEPLALRVLETGWDILRPYPEYPGRERWIDRIFYRGEDGVARPLSQIWHNRVPAMLAGATGLVQAVATTRLRLALRLLPAVRGEVRP
jgi:hypothetical protein